MRPNSGSRNGPSQVRPRSVEEENRDGPDPVSVIRAVRAKPGWVKSIPPGQSRHGRSVCPGGGIPWRALPAGTMAPFRLAFVDPPYGGGLAETALASLAEGGWLEKNAVVVVEEREGAAVALPKAFHAVDQRTYGDTQVLILRYRG